MRREIELPEAQFQHLDSLGQAAMLAQEKLNAVLGFVFMSSGITQGRLLGIENGKLIVEVPDVPEIES